MPNASATARARAVSYCTTRFGGVDGGRRGRDNGRRLATGNVDLAAPATGQLRLWRVADDYQSSVSLFLAWVPFSDHPFAYVW
jgi:hypothetical protein